MDSIQPNLLKSVSTTLPVVEVVDVLLAVAVAGVPPEDVEDGGAQGEEDEDGDAHSDGHLHLWAINVATSLESCFIWIEYTEVLKFKT